MDYYIDKLKMICEENGGVVTPKDLKRLGIDRMMVYRYVTSGLLNKESHGNYTLVNNQPDEYRIIQSRSDKMIFSHSTALFLLGISDRVPHVLDITVPQGDNITRIKKSYDQTKFHYCKKELWELGIITIKSPQGYDVKVYDVERSICDIIRDKKNVDVQIYTQAIKEYFGNMCNPRKIIYYAKMFNLEQRVRTYMEVL